MEDTMPARAEDFDINDESPEKSLVRAIFLRALADLATHIPKDIRKSAILWFEAPDDGLSASERGSYSFHDICEIFELSDIRIKKIMARVEDSRATLDIRICVEKGHTFRSKLYAEVGYIC